MSSLADLATSQIGIRFGKNKIKWNNEKSWQGSIAGVIVCFIICTLFIGVYWALIFTIAFFLFDVFTNKPLNVSDNLLIPFGSSLIFLFIHFFFNLKIDTIILTWFWFYNYLIIGFEDELLTDFFDFHGLFRSNVHLHNKK